MRFLFDLRRFDMPLLAAVFLLITLSLITLASFSYRNSPPFDEFYKQLVWILIGTCAFFIFARIDHRLFLNYSWPLLFLYGGTIVLLLATYAMPPIRGTHAWLSFGSVRFQPVELMKMALILIWAKFFFKRHVEIGRLRTIVVSFAYLVVPAAIVAKQPDLGSAIILTSLWLAMIMVSGIRIKHLAVILLIFSVSALFLWHGFLREYQKQRIMSFIFPNIDPLGASYNMIQSKVAIGSGGFWGKGIGQGTQVQYGYLPEAHTDFIFAGFVEEWGAVGLMLFIFLFGLMVVRVLRISYYASDNFSKFFCLGAASLFLIQFLLNVGSNTGILPVTGVTLPLFSYGGSSVLVNMAILGMVQGIATRLR